jgi:hypothetical protein
MKLIERTNTSNLQTYLVSEGSNTEVELELVKNNLLQRLFRYLLTSGISSIEFSSILSNNLDLKILKVINVKEEAPSLLIGSINLPTKNEDSPLSEKIIEAFKNTGVELPRDRVLSERLKELNFSSDDPFRLSNIESEVVLEESLKGLNYSDLESAENSFFDKLYSISKSPVSEKLKATYILSIHKLIYENKLQERDFTTETVDKLVEDIQDLETKTEIKKDIFTYLNSPNERPRMVDNARRTLKEGSSGINSIKTWKLIVACVFLILAVFAYTKRHSIKIAYQLSKESKDLEPSKFTLFWKTLSGNSDAAEKYVNGTKGDKSRSKDLRENEYKVAQMKADIKKFRFMKSEGKNEINDRY